MAHYCAATLWRDIMSFNTINNLTNLQIRTLNATIQHSPAGNPALLAETVAKHAQDENLNRDEALCDVQEFVTQEMGTLEICTIASINKARIQNAVGVYASGTKV